MNREETRGALAKLSDYEGYIKHRAVMQEWVDDPDAVLEFRLGIDSKWFFILEPGWLASGEYRIRPKPRFRPWRTIEEVPVGAVARYKEGYSLYPSERVIVGAFYRRGHRGELNVHWALDETAEDMLNKAEWRWPQETTWYPCGIEE